MLRQLHEVHGTSSQGLHSPFLGCIATYTPSARGTRDTVRSLAYGMNPPLPIYQYFNSFLSLSPLSLNLTIDLYPSVLRISHPSQQAHDSQPHWAMDVGSPSSSTFADFSKPASTWMHPMRALRARNVVEIPGDWDRTDFCWANFVPAAPNSQYVLYCFLPSSR